MAAASPKTSLNTSVAPIPQVSDSQPIATIEPAPTTRIETSVLTASPTTVSDGLAQTLGSIRQQTVVITSTAS